MPSVIGSHNSTGYSHANKVSFISRMQRINPSRTRQSREGEDGGKRRGSRSIESLKEGGEMEGDGEENREEGKGERKWLK